MSVVVALFTVVSVALVANGVVRLVGIGIGVFARRCTSAKKKRAIETLLVECVEGKPYSR